MASKNSEGPITHADLAEDLAARKRMLWEAEGRIFALAYEVKEQRERGESMSAVGETLRFLRTTIAHWETIRNGIERQELLLGTHRRALP